MVGRWTRRVGRLAAVAGLLGAVALSSAPRAEAGASLEEPAQQASSAALRYQWVPNATPAPPPPGGALAWRFRDLAERLEVTGEASLDDSTRAELDAVLARASRRADVSFHARDLATGAVLYDHHGARALNPASNQKVLTAAVALDVLGPGYTFETEVAQAGRTLVLRGTGDPSLDRDDLQAMAVIVAEQVELGDVERIVVDDSAFSDDRFGPGFSPEGDGAAHEAPSGALSVDFNTVEVRVAPQRGEAQPRIEIDAVGAHVEVRNEARVGRRGAIAVRTFADADRTVVSVRGTMSRRARAVVVRRRIHDPALHAGTVFAARLAEQWQAEPLPVQRGSMPDDAESLVVNESAPLAEILDRGLAYSNNFIAEQVLRTMAWRLYDEPGTWDAGAEIIDAYWSALGRTDDAVIDNGSGLSRRGRLTAAGLVDVLLAAHRGDDPALLEALPVSGEPGTMRARMRRSAGRVHAKTGTLNGVSGLSGVLTDDAGAPVVAFSILVNAHHAPAMPAASRRAIEDKVALTLLKSVD
ncbi:MAG: D-alanyl-D-alanine carboxypeptidase/D-alanyl-D-alanine-endopeptidase [Myxococcota bacterium]